MAASVQQLVKPRAYARWRIGTLIGVHVLFIAHFIHWKLHGRTLAPLEFNEVLYTVHQGIVTAGFILMALVMVATLVFGRFFCSWGCHILALQDAAGWVLDKLRIKRQPIRSRTLMWVPAVAMFYLFIWPQILQAWNGFDHESVRVVAASGSRWSSFTTDDLWRNLPPPGVAVFTFFICGFLTVYLLGSRGFCYQACPYGALFGIADQLAPGRIVLAKDCSQCGLCTKACSSDILVHRELAQYGMVSNPRCLKDLDCVAACPENAVQYGFRKPPLFRKGHPLGAYGGRFRNTLGEDLFLASAFLISFPIYRGLYDMVPFLLAVALAACSAYALLIAWRMMRRSAFQFQGHVLKMDGMLRPAGHIVAFGSMLLVALLLHSSWVQYHTWQGSRLMRGLMDNMDRARTAVAIAHYERALGIGLFAPIDRRMELASLRILAHDDLKAMNELRSIIADDAGHVEARFRLAAILHARGDAVSAMRLWRENLGVGIDRSGGTSRELLARSALELSTAYDTQGDPKEAEQALQDGLKRVPDDASLLTAAGSMAHRLGRPSEALTYLEMALAHGGQEDMLRNNLGALHMAMGELDAAIAHLTRLVELRPSDPRARLSLAAAHARRGQWPEARTQLDQASRLDPGDERIKQAMAMLEQGTPRTTKP